MKFIYKEERKGAFWKYFLALVVCVIFYFLVAGVAITKLEPVLVSAFNATADEAELIKGMNAIISRTLCGWIGIWIGVRLVLQKSLSDMIGNVYKGSVVAAFFVTFITWTIILLVKDGIYGLATGSSLSINPYIITHSSIFAASIIFCLILVPVHALAEEVIYRSIPLKGFYQLWAKLWFTILVSAILFTLNHGGFDTWFWMPLSIMLAIIAITSKNIIYTWAIHTGTNFYYAQLVSNPAKDEDQSLALLIRSEAMQQQTSLLIDLICVFLFTTMLFLILKWKVTK